MTNTTSTRGVVDLGTPWPGVGPFLFTAHHVDHYPRGNAGLGPASDISDRPLGSDFGNPAGWNMYHGSSVPGFPAHPHRGFETITIVTKGIVDHADSTGASARYGVGDVQWVTAGRGVSHSEMFPLLEQDEPNPFELYQIWLNLPARDKGADPAFAMFWNEDIPLVRRGGATIKVIAGTFDTVAAPTPPAHSWAADLASDLAIWLIELEPNAVLEVPGTQSDATQRMLYVHGDGSRVDIDGSTLSTGQGYAQLDQGTLTVRTAGESARVLLLQGVPLNEPVAQHGPFVMNTQQEIAEAFADYRATQFGGWPWPSDAPVHDRETGRFALHGDGRIERPSAADGSNQ
ncbi:pirin family protein [Gordonia sp. CPCC 205515]|uniref:pirin family protein n=1 Tax=Gordonia sp. CPCC 205515 TaxID=3140791 RepID=UPI003AF3AED6